MEPTSLTLICIIGVVAVVAPVATALLVSRRKPGAKQRNFFLRFLPALLMVALCQVLAVGTVFLVVNRSYGFYNSWSDLLGHERNQPDVVQTTSLDAGQGKIATLDIEGSVSGVKGQAIVWLPPQYDAAANAAVKYPVVMMLPGQPSSPQIVYNEYHFGTVASQAIADHDVKPFIAVFPPIMINPPRDTECVDVPSGPQAESWLTKDVTAAVQTSYRVQPVGKQWTVMGWSTGGLCAAKLTLKLPQQFGAGVSFGGEMVPYVSRATGDLWHGDEMLRKKNSPLWLYKHHQGTRGARLLIIAGQQDKDSYPNSLPLIQVAQGNPSVSVIAFPKGGHNDQAYASYLPTVLHWLAQGGNLG